MKEKINFKKLLYIFILINPVFDLLSSLFTHLEFSYTPSTFLRPIIPLFVLIYLFFKDKFIRKKLFILGIIYSLYCLFHIIIYNNLITGISYGGIFHELQYLFNYTYLIFLLFMFIYIFKEKDMDILKEALFYNVIFYIASIYIAIVTNTSFSSYVEGFGYKGWFNTSGAVGTILVLSLFVLIPYIVSKNVKNIYKFILIFFILIYLCFFIGSRVGLFGSVIVVFTYLFSYLIFGFKKIKDIIFTKKTGVIVSSIMVTGFLFVIFGSSTFKRREHLDDIKDDEIHIAYDLVEIKENIDNNLVPMNYVSKEQRRALDSLYKYANDKKIPNVDLRKQQLVYHYYLWKYQDKVELKLFGNGYLSNYGSLTLEMEELALFFNFGIFGFILFFVPFLATFSYSVVITIKNKKKLDIEYAMYIAGIIISYFISLLAGHTYFNTSVMPVIIILHVLLYNKAIKIKGAKGV